MGDLHAAIAASLRGQRRRRAKTGAGEARIRKSWHDPYLMPRSRIAGAAIEDDDGGRYTLADMRQVRECALQYTRP
jgi:hypothetical protein